ncbi:DUF5801 repeats-in-toxin domain-containing protein [Marinobacterium rhizophilum]|uniref:VCBS domain-containing protein n=1 Tax=Marinobacterium rhizophilum TaxID=420402 RepID=A0ABY5HG64_9GAMM|nr:DUF5801 repeats-in-toxin domain-containing protein [Marinobacterium rhizophilum]UTW11275.1 VCBS domain-containing protein [Marinobacterium rhizophilum]
MASYSYQLSGPVTDVDGVPEQDLFTLSVSDGSASSANSSITIDIVDDVPVAVDDSKALGEDDSAAISGNVLSNDLHGNGEAGADAPVTFVQWTGSTSGQYGSFTDNGNGGYSYTLNTAHAAVQGLDDGQSLTETFSYQITDADGDTDTATLTLTINGSNDGPGVSVDPGNVGGGNDSVNEAGLAGGSAAGDGSDAASGTFTLSDADGLDDLVSVTINGSTILIADLEGSVIAGANGHGNLTIDSYNAATGVASYSYQLSGPVTDVDGVPEQDLFTLSVSDGSASSANSSITIDIVDDVPVAVDDSKALGEDDSAAISGNVLSNDLHGNGEAGADAPVTFVQWTGSTSGQYGSFTDNGNGGYSYTLNTAHAAVQGLDDGQSLTETFSYQITDADGDTDTATLTLTINGSNDGPGVSVDPGNVGGGNDSVNEAGLAGGSAAGDGSDAASGTFTLSDADGLDDLVSVTINGSTILIADLEGSVIPGANGHGNLTIDSYNAATGVASYSYQLSGPVTDVDGVPEQDLFTLSVSDGSASSANSSITIDIIDDVPSISVAAGSLDGVSLLTQDAETGDDANPDTATSAAAFDGVFSVSSSAGGADGQSGAISWNYALSLSVVSGTASGLKSGGVAVKLYQLADGTIVGSTSPTAPVVIDDAVVFSLGVDGAGVVTLSQYAALDHGIAETEGAYDDDVLSLASNLVNLTGTATITDNDGDSTSHSQSVDLGGTVSFADDGPTVTLTIGSDSRVTLKTQDAETLGNLTDTATSNAAFGVAIIASLSSGADSVQASGLSYVLSLTSQGADSLLTSGSEAVYLYTLADGTLVGSTATTNPGSVDASVVFSLSVDSDGKVTLSQHQALDHATASTSGFESDVLILSNGLVNLQVTYSITDGDGDSATSTKTIDLGGNVQFADDGPSLAATNLVIANETGTYSGTYAFDVGADVQSFADSFDGSALQWTNAEPGYSLEYDAAGSNASQQLYKGVYEDGGDSFTFFTLQVNADGTYDFNMVTPDPVIEKETSSLLSGISGGSNLASYTFGASQFGGEFEIVVTGKSHGGADTLTISSTDLGVSDNVMHGNKTDVLRFDVQQVAGRTGVLSELTIQISNTAGVKITDTVGIRIHYTTGPDDTYAEAIGADYSITMAADPSREVEYMQLFPANSDVSFKITGLSGKYVTSEFPDDYALDFTLSGSDSDGDSASASFSVNVNATDNGSALIEGTSGSDTLFGTASNDILTGHDGADLFVWSDGDEGGVGPGLFAEDTVTDFNPSEGDVLDLSDLLVGETEATLDAYLYLDDNGTDSTLYVSTSGNMNAADATEAATKADQVINLTDLSGTDLDALLASGNLTVDNS